MRLRKIYFVQGEKTRLIKIGISYYPLRRLKDMQTGSPDKLTLLGVRNCYDGSTAIVYSDFARDRLHGEWFRPSEQLLDFINQNTRAWNIADEEAVGEL